MDRRKYLTTITTLTAVSIAGCMGDDEIFEDDAGSYILSDDEVSESLPGTFEQIESREPNIDPAGLESSEIRIYENVDGTEAVDLVVAVSESESDAETLMSDFKAEVSDDEMTEQDTGDDAFSVTLPETTQLYVRESNVYIQITGTQHISNLRELAEAQIDALS